VNPIRILAPEAAQAIAVSHLGLDPAALDLSSREAIAAVIRRAAVFSSPLTKQALRGHVTRCIDGLVTSSDLESEIDDAIEVLTGSGDLLELREDSHSQGSLLYTAPASFVSRQSGVTILLGSFPDDVTPLPKSLRDRIEYRGHIRIIASQPGENLGDHLRQLGFMELPERLWLRHPRMTSPEALVRQTDGLLDAQASIDSSEGLQGLIVLDPSKANTFYPGRWHTAERDGRYVARREQRYGSALWSYVSIVDSRVQRLLDFPRSDWRGCDEAWHLQAAIDACLGHPQAFSLRKGPPNKSVIVDFFSPLPSWAQRRMDLLGERVSAYRSLFAYRLSEQDFGDESRFLVESLWMKERKN
jgi:hypothetical protein